MPDSYQRMRFWSSKRPGADAGGDPGVHVSRVRIMEQTAITELEEFVGVVEYLAERGFIAEGVNRYELFVVTLRGIGAGNETQRTDL
jgi:hypothetical protein